MKSYARRQARKIRSTLFTSDAGQKLAGHLPNHIKTHTIAGYSPIGDEIDIWPLLKSLHRDAQCIALPVIIGPEQPLMFREWQPDCEMETDRYGVAFPAHGPAKAFT